MKSVTVACCATIVCAVCLVFLQFNFLSNVLAPESSVLQAEFTSIESDVNLYRTGAERYVTDVRLTDDTLLKLHNTSGEPDLFLRPSLPIKLDTSQSNQFSIVVQRWVDVVKSTVPLDIRQNLNYYYLAEEKELPYVGSSECEKMFGKAGEKDNNKFLNCWATFPTGANMGIPNQASGMHGLIGFNKLGERVWTPGEMPPLPNTSDVDMPAELKRGGGFYLNLSDALPLDRESTDSRNIACLAEQYNLTKLEDASIIFTFYNEPLSTLLRSVHSVLNKTPPSLVREIILVDDHSDATHLQPGRVIYDIIATLPKVKIVRLPVRRGIVTARMAGAKLAVAPILVVLDSHIEVNNGWLEPQLQRLAESPRSVVTPQIDSIDTTFFNYSSDSGIGCWLGFRWNMQEQASLTPTSHDTHIIPSPSMAGGLFAVRADWFWKLGGYDAGFQQWGAENVEMGFRVWMCGGRVECAPCARVYHIYRHGGAGYTLTKNTVDKNKLRTARVWTDQHYLIAREFIAADEVHMGNIDQMLKLKEELQCKEFNWYLRHVDPENDLADLNNVLFIGEIQSVADQNVCVDTLSKSKPGQTFGVFSCHGQKGTQGYLMTASGRVMSLLNERDCLSAVEGVKHYACEYVLEHGALVMTNLSTDTTSTMKGHQVSRIAWIPTSKVGEEFIRSTNSTSFLYLTLEKLDDLNFTILGALQTRTLMFSNSVEDSTSPDYAFQQWRTTRLDIDAYVPPTYSQEYLTLQKRGEIISDIGSRDIAWKYGRKPNGEIVDQMLIADI